MVGSVDNGKFYMRQSLGIPFVFGDNVIKG